MNLYIEEIKLGRYSNISFYTALEAYYNMGFEIIKVRDFNDVEIQKDNIFLGSIQFMHKAMEMLNIVQPDSNDYPLGLRKYLKRRVWTSTINKIAFNPESWNVFVKPKSQKKKFVGRLVNNTKDLISCGDIEQDTEFGFLNQLIL